MGARVPLLRPKSSNPYAAWRPQMETFMMRAGIEARDYKESIPHWAQLEAAMTRDAAAAEHTHRGVGKELWPEHLVILDELPRSSGGKIAKGELQALVRSRDD